LNFEKLGKTAANRRETPQMMGRTPESTARQAAAEPSPCPRHLKGRARQLWEFWAEQFAEMRADRHDSHRWPPFSDQGLLADCEAIAREDELK
jgi:hypothetical protein